MELFLRALSVTFGEEVGRAWGFKAVASRLVV
jgi:hypothetical protein